MKKIGFTLAEILVTLGILGVISALVVPSFVSNAQSKANVAKLSDTISILETAFSSMMIDEGVVDFSETEFIQNSETNELTKYLKITNTDSSSILGPENYPELNMNYLGKTISGDKILTGSEINSMDHHFVLKNGAFVSVGKISPGNNISVFVDANHGSKPNISGKDIFMFVINNEGKLLAYGSKALCRYDTGAGHWETSSLRQYACNNTYKGIGCTGRLIENNFVIDY